MIVAPTRPGYWEFTTDLLSALLHFEVGNANVGSLQLLANNDDDFATGVLTIGKANLLDVPPTALSTPQTITAPGYIEIGGTDWCKATYLTLQVTTAASSARSVTGVLQLKSLILN